MTRTHAEEELAAPRPRKLNDACFVFIRERINGESIERVRLEYGWEDGG